MPRRMVRSRRTGKPSPALHSYLPGSHGSATVANRRKSTARRPMRLLPLKHEQGWLPYGWLIYLLIFLLYPFEGRASALEWTLTAAAVCAFLPLYFWGYWLNGKRILIPIGGIAALGMTCAPWNAGASVFFVYA